MKRWILFLILPLVAVAFAQDQPQNEVIADNSAQLWFVELSSPPTADGAPAAGPRRDKENFRNAARAAGIEYQERYAFDTLWNGLSILVQPDSVPALRRLPGVSAIYPVESIPAPRPDPSDEMPDLASAVAQTGADIARNSFGLTGAGVRVGIIDSGIDYDHPDLGGGFGPGFKVAFGTDFVGDGFSSGPPVPDDDPDDCPNPSPGPNDPAGHGTHVAGIVGANGVVRGVAPGATLGAYRVFGCFGGTSSDIILAAMERAFADDMDVINMSIGSFGQWPQFPTAQASDRMVNRGIVVVTSAGNSGAAGLYSMSAPGVGKKSIGVASFNNSHLSAPFFTATPDDRPFGYTNSNGVPRPTSPPTSGTFSLLRTGTQASVDDGCVAHAPGSLGGAAALIRRGTCGFYNKAINAQNAGAASVVLYNNAAGTISPTITPNPPGSPVVTIPVVMLSQADGNLLDTRLAGGTVSITWQAGRITSPNPTGNRISGFSSYGLSPDLALKPDIGAPGGLIFSTYPLEQGGYATLSGTSMSSPHVAGAVALLLEAKPSTSSQEVRAILQNSSEPKPWFGNPTLGFLDNTHRQGSGMLRIDRAITATTRVEPGKLSLGESEFGPAVETLTIENHGAAPVTYSFGHEPALATGPNTFVVGFFNAPATVTFSQPSLTVPAGGVGTVDLTVSPNAGLPDRSIYGGYVVITPAGEAALRVPYSGFKGDYQSIQAVTPSAPFNFPWLAKRTLTGFSNRPAGETYTMGFIAGSTTLRDFPNFLIQLSHPVRRLRAQIIDADSGKSWHRAFDFDYVRRNTAAGPNAANNDFFFSIAWDGITVNGNKTNTVPNGRYQAVFTVQKALGDDGNPAHTETWTSPVITIARP